jgi:oxalate decarboxylase
MRLQPGCLRELHWHTTAAELGYVVSGSCRTTVLSPDGAATDTFGPGDVWYFPSGWGHSIQGTGPGECHFILVFDNGAFSCAGKGREDRRRSQQTRQKSAGRSGA